MASISFLIFTITSDMQYVIRQELFFPFSRWENWDTEDRSETWLSSGLLSEHSQSRPEKPDFYSPTPTMILTQVCKLHHRHLSLPLWTCSLSTFWDPAKCCLSGHPALLGRAGLLSWHQHAVHTQETMYNVFWTFSGRAVVEQPNYPTTSDNAQGSGCGIGNLIHTNTVSKLSSQVNISYTTVQSMIHLRCLHLWRSFNFFGFAGNEPMFTCFDRFTFYATDSRDYFHS